MAGLAVGLGMRSGQWETGGQMVKACAASLCGWGRRGKHEQGQHHGGEHSQVAGGEARHVVIPFSRLSHGGSSLSVKAFVFSKLQRRP
jgi:hypothetical protein